MSVVLDKGRSEKSLSDEESDGEFENSLKVWSSPASSINEWILPPFIVILGEQADYLHSVYQVVLVAAQLALDVAAKTGKGVKLSPTTWKEIVSHTTLLEGPSGVGKTTVIKHLISSSHARQPGLHILYFDLSDDRVCESKQWPQDLLPICGHKYERSLVELERTGGEDCLVVIDQYTDRSFEPECIVGQLLKGNILRRSKKVIASRSCYAENLMSMVQFDRRFKVKGFALDGLEYFFNAHSKYAETLILPFLKQNRMIEMCKSPLVSSCVLSVFKELKNQLPKTLTDFMYNLTCELVVRDFDQAEKADLSVNKQIKLEKLPDTVKTALETICQLAMEHLLSGHKCIDLDESQQFLSSFFLKQSRISWTELFRFGLVEKCTGIEPCRYAYVFLSPIMMEFLAAYYLFCQPPLNQLYFLYVNCRSLFTSGFTLWLRFFFGLIGKNYTSDSTQQNPTKLMMNTVVDVLVTNLELNHEPEYRCNLIECIHELQEKSLYRKLASKHPSVLNFSIQGNFDRCVQPVLSLISKCGFSVWTISTSTSNMEHVGKLKDQVRGVTIVVKVNDSIGEMVSVNPNRNPAEVAKMYREVDSARRVLTGEEKAEKFNQYCCRAVREILQRVFLIYSEVKIKGDSSNVSYVSFLTCKCFEKSFSENVRMFPLQPIHFLKGPKKDFSKLPPESLTNADRHNLAKHDGLSLEVVIMLRPLIQRVEGTVPATNEEFSLVLSHDLILDFSDDVESELVATQRCFDNYEVNGIHTEQILPVLPVVQKTIYGRSQTAYPKPFIPPPQVPKPDTLVQAPDEVEANTPQFNSRRSTSSSLNPHHPGDHQMAVYNSPTPSINPHLHSDLQRLNRYSPAQAGGTTSIQPSQLIPTYVAEQAVGETQQVQVQQAVTSRRQTALRAGTVLFTSIPEKIPSDRIQPLPLQRTLIRKGGNGSIFSENVGGTALAVKKTSYRSKEFAIITKIRHKNIVPLLAYVWGEEHRESRRRYYVYHYLPKLSGDLARLVTDKEELSLYEFHKENQMNFRATGVAVGNIKYTLSQVLEGLHYLHKLHIAHRDLKASNVLIKFFCACATPLECACEVKYQVVLCDYDAAIELDSNDCIPGSGSSSSRPQTGMSSHLQAGTTSHPPSRTSSRPPTSTSHPPTGTFEIVPVGTNGFRSPESSMHTIANTPTAFSPPLTTKTDIYSFGILALRLMISSDTPYSQRSMAILLLHYHQMKGVSEGRISQKLSPYQQLDQETVQLLAGRRWMDYLRIGEGAVLKILKLSKLRPRVRWLRGGYEFVRQCLNVDPEARPTAGNLLADPFLN